MRKLIFLIIIILTILAGCTTQKNTPLTRAYHNLTAHYNVFFNGKTALQEAIKNVNQNCSYDYYDILPVFPYECPNAKTLTASKMNRVLEKAAKTIKNHSITVKPEYKNLRNLTPAQLEFYKKNEYVKWIDDSYLLIAIANLYKGEISKSQQALHRILDKYATENTYYDAQIWLARSYIVEGRYKEAFVTLQNFEKEKNYPKRLKKDLYLTYADLYIHTEKYDKAIDYLKKAVKLEKNKRLKAKYVFIIAQLYLKLGDKSKSSEYFKKVAKYTPTYEMEFNAQLYRATALGTKDNPEQIRKKLEKMLKDEKNEEYKDRIYYALAQLELQVGDTAQAIKYFRQGINSSRDQTQKGLTYLTLADLYFKTHKYLLAGKYYDSTLQTLPRDYKDYAKIQAKSKSLIDLAKNLETVYVQDSLQRLAKLPKKEVLKIIDSIINAKKQQELAAAQNYNPGFDPLDPESQRFAAGLPTQQSQGGKWYFYNPMLVSRGKQLFRQRWGDRKLEDNWRLKVKSPVEGDNLAGNEENAEEEKQKNSREFYLKQIPYTDSALQASNEKIIEALFNAAIIYQNKLQDYQQAVNVLEELLRRFPDNKYTLDSYYYLYLLYKKLGKFSEANKYKNLIINNYPNSQYALILSSPNYLNSLLKREKQAQDLLIKTIDLYENLQYQAVIDTVNNALTKYKGTSVIPNLLFLKAKAYGALGQKDSLVNGLEYVINQYPKSTISKLASEILKQLKEGSLHIEIYKYEPSAKHVLVLFVDDPKLTNEEKFELYKLANEFFQDKVMETEIAKLNKQTLIILKTFDNLQQAKNFENYLKNNWKYRSKWLLFSEQNLKTFIKDKDRLKYQIFYSRYYK